MSQHDPLKSNPSASSKGGFTRYLLPLALLVATIGGIAWVAQQLPKWKDTKSAPTGPRTKALLEFTRKAAQWGKTPENGEAKIEPKDYEPGAKGHYDFPFKNVTNEDVEVVYYASSCDCTSVQAVALDASEWSRVNAQSLAAPGDEITYNAKPAWVDLIRDIDWRKASPSAQKEKAILIKPGAGGVVRVHWVAKSAGSVLNVTPKVGYRAASTGAMGIEQQLGVPVMVASPVRFTPQRVQVGALTISTSTTAEFYAWSSTRDHLDLKLRAGVNDALFEFDYTPLRVGGIFSRSDCSDILASFDKDKPHAHIRSALKVKATVHESRNGQYLDLGSYHRKMTVLLDGFEAEGVPGPELTGRVQGEIIVGGADDQGRVRLKSFNANEGVSRTLELSTDASWKLEEHKHMPAWIKVNLSRAKEQPDPKRTIWRLEVTVPEKTPGVRSLEDPDAIVLRVVGPPERFVRIPIEGQLGGR
jgi:hypothetical protein